jgi:hypothetical protein
LVGCMIKSTPQVLQNVSDNCGNSGSARLR